MVQGPSCASIRSKGRRVCSLLVGVSAEGLLDVGILVVVVVVVGVTEDSVVVVVGVVGVLGESWSTNTVEMGSKKDASATAVLAFRCGLR